MQSHIAERIQLRKKESMKKSGFTLIELIIVVTVILVISVVTLLNYNAYTDKQRVKQAGLTLRSDLRSTQTKATAGQKPVVCSEATLVSYQVTFSTCGGTGACYEIQPVCVANETTVDTTSEVTRVYLPSGVTFFASYPPIQFFSVTGVTNLTADMMIQLSGAGVAYIVLVSPSGSVSDF